MDDAAAVMQNLDRGNAVIARCRHGLIRFTNLYDASGKNSQGTATIFVSDFVPQMHLQPRSRLWDLSPPSSKP